MVLTWLQADAIMNDAHHRCYPPLLVFILVYPPFSDSALIKYLLIIFQMFVSLSLFQLRLARYAVPLVMISCLYFKVNHYLFIYLLVHFMCCTLSFAIVELSQFVQMCIDGREANQPQNLNMDVEIRSEKQVKYHEICLSHSLALMFSVTVSVIIFSVDFLTCVFIWPVVFYPCIC